MNSLSDARASLRRAPGRGLVLAVALGLGLLLVLGGVGVLAVWIDGSLPGTAVLALVALLGALLLVFIAALGWHVGVRLTRQRLGEALREARMHAQMLSQLQPDWQWSTDAEHHIVCWRAPQGAVASSWVGVTATQVFWERFTSEEPGREAGLRGLLQAQGNFAALRVRSLDGSPWLLRGLASFDGHGRFAGYQGTAQALGGAGEGRDAGASALPDLQEQQAFSYTVSHDLRAPLRVVEGFARILKEDYGHQLDRVGNDHVDRVMAAAARMNSMIDALLALSRISAQPLARQPVNLSQLAEFVLDDLCKSAPERCVDLHVQPHLVVQGDPTLLRMALENLLGNAWKYSGKCSGPSIRFEAALEGGRRIYCVADNGAGFDMRAADRLFGVFQRLHSASEFQGTGVGLASVRRIVQRHGGEVWAESETGQGARFYFTLAG